MKKTLLSSLLFTICTTVFCTTWTITNSGLTFSPATITINADDSILFSIANMHNAVEVSQTTWNANGTTPLPGFSVPFGGGLVLPAQLTTGTHYYVCTAHASSGMKGTIIVQNALSIPDVALQPRFSIYPNPSNGKFQLSCNSLLPSNNCNIKVYDLRGQMVYECEVTDITSEIDLNNLNPGIYFIRFSDGQSIQTRKIVIQ